MTGLLFPFIEVHQQLSKKKQVQAAAKLKQPAKSPGQATGLKIILFLAAVLLYANTIPNGYNLDDELVTQNHRLTSKGVAAIPEIFTSPYYQDNMGYAYEYRPVTLTTFAIEHQLTGDNAHVSHFVNVVLYGLTALLLFIVLQYVFREYQYNYLLPLTATLLFVAHPLHTEVVASIKNRDELLSLLGGLGALYFALRYVEQRTLALWGLFLLCFVLGLLSKRSMIPFAVIIPVATVLFRQTRTKDIFLLVVCLSILIPLFSPVYLLIDKILIGAAIIGLPLIIQLLVHERALLRQLPEKMRSFSAQIAQQIQKQLSVARSTMAQKVADPTNASEQAQGKDGDSDNSKGESSLSLFWFALGGISFIISLGALLMDIPMLAGGGMLLVLASAFFSNSPIRHGLLIPLSILISLHAWFYGELMYTNVLLMFLIAEIFDLRRSAIPLVAVALIFPLLVDVGAEGWLSPLKVAAIVAFVVLVKKLPAKLSTPLGLLFLVSGGVIIFTSDWTGAIPLLFLAGIAISALWSAKLPQRLPDLLLLLGVMILLPFNDSIQSNVQQIPAVQQMQKVKNQNPPAPQALPSDYREIDYVENPIPHLESTNKKLAISFYSLGTYLQKLVFPHPLSYYYGYRRIPVVTLAHPYVIASVVVYTALLGLAIFLFFYNRKVLAFGIGLFLVGIFPFSNIISPVAGIVGERLTYVASLGFCLALAYALLWAFQVDMKRAKPSFAKLPKSFILLMGILLVASSFKTIQRNNQWEDHLTLFRNDIEHLEESAQAHNLLASHLIKNSFNAPTRKEAMQMRQEARTHFTRAIDIRPGFFNPIYDLGRTYLLLDNRQQAKKVFQRAIEVNPDYSNSYLKLANIYFEEQNFEKAIPLYQKVTELTPNKIGAFTNLSFIYFQQGKYNKSIDINQEALRKNPQSVDPRINLGKTYMRMGDNQQAIRYFEKAFNMQPNNYNVANALAQLYQQLGNASKASYYRRQAQALRGQQGQNSRRSR